MFCMTFCVFVQDMKKFGGPNKMRQKCRLRQCLVKSRVRIFFYVVKFDVFEIYSLHQHLKFVVRYLSSDTYLFR